MKESDGDLSPSPLEFVCCRRCDRTTAHHVWRWDSHDGAFVDFKYQCINCGSVHWSEGIDS